MPSRPDAALAPGYRNQLEPLTLLQQFVRHPPEGFEVLGAVSLQDAPAFVARLDLLTSAEPAFKRRVQAWPLYRRWAGLLQLRSTFVGTTVSEYALLPRTADVSALPARWLADWGRRCPLLVVKDIPQNSPLLGAADNMQAEQLAQACAAAGYVLLEGQALAYVPIAFDGIEGYLQRLSSGRRKNLRRKLRSLAGLDVRRVPTGNAFDDPQTVERYYALYESVYAQSEVHFDKLGRAFLAGVLRDGRNGGIVFEYRERNQPDAPLLGWNLCFEVGGKLIDKYIGLVYPEARAHNLYFVSWIVNLGYAIERGLTHYVAGWTDPEVKAQLGAEFTFTRHAVFIRNPLLRLLGRRFAKHFEGDRSALEARE